MLLDKSSRSLKTTIVTAYGSNGIDAYVHYEDTLREAISSAVVLSKPIVGDSEICPAPDDNTAREIIEIMLENNDSATHDVTVFILDNATKYPVKFSAALASGKTFHYNRFNGWAVV